MKNASRRILGVIPARGGSKGVPRKNISLVGGKPLIAYSIESAKQSRLITDLIVSTDSEEIAEVARLFGAEVPFQRPDHLATDRALSVDVVKHALAELGRAGRKFDYVVLLQPTTPLRQATEIDGALEKLFRTGCDTVVSVVDVGAHHPTRMYRIEEDHLIGVMDEGVKMRPRQEQPPIYIRSGDVYACKTSVVETQNTLMGKDTRPYVIQRQEVVNIDCPADMILADYYLSPRITGDSRP